jgi:hypothetical protein
MREELEYLLALYYREEIEEDEIVNKIFDMAKIQLPVRIEEEQLNELKELAKADNRTLSNYVDTMIKNHIADRQKMGRKKINTGL